MALFQGCTAKAGGVLPRALDPSSLEPGAATYEVRWLGGHHASQRGLVWHRPRLPVMPCQVPNTVMNKPWRLQLISPSSQVTLDVQVFPAKATGSSQDKPSAIPAVPRLNAHSQNSWTYYNSHRYSCFRVLRLEVICDRAMLSGMTLFTFTCQAPCPKFSTLQMPEECGRRKQTA